MLDRSGWEEIRDCPLGKTQADSETLCAACHRCQEESFAEGTAFCIEQLSLGLFASNWLQL